MAATLNGNYTPRNREELAWEKAREWASDQAKLMFPPGDPRGPEKERSLARIRFRELMYP